MMKILLLGFTKISYMPYMHFYIKQLKKNNCDISILYWDRDGKLDTKIPEGVIGYKFNSYVEDSFPLICKIHSFIKYRKFAKKILREHKFDKLIILHSTPGIVLFDILKKSYHDEYILDYRDFTYETIKFYRYLIHQLVLNSQATFVSSDGYRKYLPKSNKIYTSHNLLIDSLYNRNIRRSKSRDIKPIRIRFWGFLRGKEINTNIVDALGNDMRFELHYHGREQEQGRNLRKYCKEKGLRNIYFHGAYKPEDRYQFASETDLLHNMYENDAKTMNAMGNKYYDGLIFYIPQLCNEGSYMGNQVKEHEIGITLTSDDKNFNDEVYRYYHSIDWFEFEKNCDSVLEGIMKQYYEGVHLLQKIM